MDNQPQWISDPEDAQYESWMSDAPWAKAADRGGYVYLIPTKGGVMRGAVSMAFVKSPDMERQLFYGDGSKGPEEMTGLSSYYNTRDPNAAQNAVNVLDGGGRDGADLTSAWIVGWGPTTAFMVTPDGLPPPYMGGCEMALVIKNWRSVVRIANIPLAIDSMRLQKILSGGIALWPAKRESRPVIYMMKGLCAKLPQNRFAGFPMRAMNLVPYEAYVPAEELQKASGQ